MIPDRFGRRFPVARQPFVPAARRDHREAACPRPIDEIAGQGRLIAIGKAVDHTGLPRSMRQDRSAERIGLDGHVDDRLAGSKRRLTVFDSGRRIASALGDHVDTIEFDQRFPIVGDVRRAIPERIVEGHSAIALLGPSDALQALDRARRRQIGDADDMNARRSRRLVQVHRAELSRANQANPDGTPLGFAREEFCMEVHDSSPGPRCHVRAAIVPSPRTVSTMWIQ